MTPYTRRDFAKLALAALPAAGLISFTPPARAAADAPKGEKAPRVDKETAKARAEELRQWRTSVSMERVKDFRKKYHDAGLLVEILKVDGIFNLADDVLDYYFAMAKTVGA